MYVHFFPSIERTIDSDLLKRDGITLDVPKCYYVNIEEASDSEAGGTATVVVLEELKSLGYQMADKVKGADYNLAVTALTSLAHYHALTIHFLRNHIKDGTLPEPVAFLNDRSTYKSMQADTSRYFTSQIELMTLLDQEDVNMTSIISNVWKKSCNFLRVVILGGLLDEKSRQ